MTLAPEPISVTRTADDCWAAETQIFNDNLPWIGLRIAEPGNSGSVTPMIVLPSGRREPMMRIALSGQDGLWIENGTWDAGSARHLSALHRESGQVIIEAGTMRIVLDHTMGGAGRLDDYLADFRNEFLWLALNADGKTRGDAAGGGGLNLEVVEALAAFAAAARAVADRPSSEIREIVENSPAARIRPTAATFRHHARDPAARTLPGRKAVESLDTPENRYLRHMIASALRLARSATRAFGSGGERLRAAALHETARAETLAATEWRQVDPVIFDNQSDERARRVREVLAYTNSEPTERSAEYKFEFTRSYGKSGGEFFYKPLNQAAQGGPDMSYCVARCDAEAARLITGVLAYNRAFAIVGEAQGQTKKNSKGHPYHEVGFTSISSIRMRDDVIERRAAERRRLEANDWRKPITDNERRELAAEARTAMLRAGALECRAGEIERAGRLLDETLHVLQILDRKLADAGVRQSPAVPMGQRYLQSPRYTAGLKAYRGLEAALTRSGIGFGTLERLYEVTPLHASALYERWCLVKILAVLVEDYGFEPPRNWQARLVRPILDRAASSAIELRRPDIGLVAYVQYQASLANGRRPDFIVSFPRLGGPRSERPKGLVLDAKFRTRWKPGQLPGVVEELCETKGYDCEGDRVFVLHPIAGSITTPTSPLGWGHDCDYGQERHCHRHGSIQLAAGSAEARLNLKRLIAMELQSHLCIQCGSGYEPEDRTPRSSGVGWDVTCRTCSFSIWETHCYDCRYPIYKNGIQMTYHRTLADQITNIACPSCGYHF